MNLLQTELCNNAVPHLRALHIKGTDARLDLAFGPKSVPDNALSAISQPFIGKPRDKCVSFGLQHLCQHPPRAFTGNLCQRIVNLSQLVKGQDQCIFIHGVSRFVRFWLA